MFRKARINLTAWYVLIIMLVSASFSILIYELLTSELERFSELHRLRLEKQLDRNTLLPYKMRFPQEHIPKIFLDPELLQDTKHRIVHILLLVNGGILVFSAGLAYFLSGKTLEPIRNMVTEQKQFISDASHEMKTPLTSLKTSMEVYLRAKATTDSDSKKLIRENLEEVNKLQLLTEKLLELAQFQNNGNSAKAVSFSLLEVISKAVAKIKPLATQKSIEINIPIEDIKLTGYPESILELLVILLDNAIKYSTNNSTVRIVSKRTDGSVHISIIDQGIGIDAKDIPHIFDRFYRSDRSRTKSGSSGFGLGLAIAKKIAENNHGTLTVKSKTGEGSSFTLKLPRLQLKPL